MATSASGTSTSDHNTNSNSSVGREKIEKGIVWKVPVALVLVQLGYGSSYILNKVALTNGVNPIVYALYRDVVGLIALIPIAFFTERRKRTSITLEVFLLLLGLGFLGPCITQLLSLYGLRLTSAAYASTISVLTPLFTFIISTACGFEQIRWRRPDGLAKLAGLISAMFGAVVLAVYVGPVVLGHLGLAHLTSASDTDTHGLAPLLMYFNIGPWHLGILCLFLGGLSLSLTISIQSPILARYPAPISVSAYAYLLGSIMLLTTALLTVDNWSDLVITEKTAVISYVYNGLVTGAFNSTMLTWCVQKAGPVLVGSYVPFRLFTTAALAYVFLGEGLHLGSVLGAILLINGLAFISWGQAKGRSEPGLPTKGAPSTDGIPITLGGESLEEPLRG